MQCKFLDNYDHVNEECHIGHHYNLNIFLILIMVVIIVVTIYKVSIFISSEESVDPAEKEGPAAAEFLLFLPSSPLQQTSALH